MASKETTIMNRTVANCFWTASIAATALAITGCASYCGFDMDDLHESYLSTSSEYAHRAPTDCEHVAVLDTVPSDRKFIEIGVVSPRHVKAKAYANAIRAARAAAALNGADAIIILSENDKERWESGYNTNAGNSRNKYIILRCKAIVWVVEK